MNSIPRFARRVCERSPQSWSCLPCRSQAQQIKWPLQRNATNAQGSSSPRFVSESSTRNQLQTPPARPQPQTVSHSETMDRMKEVYKRKNRSTMFYTLSIILGTVAFSYGSVPLYKMICTTTGFGGQPVRHGDDGSADLTAKLQPVKDAKRIRVTFNSSVSDTLPWKFVPQQREVRVLPGETALAFYTATNKSDQDIIGVATYSVTPGQVAPYFSKIQCFCFEEQRLNAGETVDMPVFFYLDPDLLNDINMRGVETVTLNYTFFSAFPFPRTYTGRRTEADIPLEAKYDNNGNFKDIPQPLV
ncbi:cytochrome c oxidase assembly protein CtaG/Cox11-domain-containing protein [Podospora didyma]|uniref:Cytochrome c oxidase assembly protein CtaG/Cox11-domain-containing protein n=1 Tax=Podospora didyma TaxID=330526 RepID=A0AAE0NSY8_9PEZI|nr:cytochrome c oxidase assembly protein CtaG/Cox11-domain-containing protein [Podospora didyma]